MEFVVSFALSLGFGLFWMWWYYRQDIYDKEPKRFVALIFILSMPLSVLTGLLQYSLDQGTAQLSEKSGFWVSALFYIGVVGVTEELAKFFVVYTVALPNRVFNEPMDGIIYAAAAALGFASFENVFYVLDRGPLVLLLRGPFASLGHVLFSAIWGAALGMSLHETEPRRRARPIIIGLVLSILAHGVYNILVSFSSPVFARGYEWLSLSGLVFLGGLYILVSLKISQALKVSSFNPGNQARQAIQLLRERRQANLDRPIAQPEPAPQRYAPNPNRYQFRSSSQPDASVQISGAATTQNCPNCGAANLTNPTPTNCYNCGDDLSKDVES